VPHYLQLAVRHISKKNNTHDRWPGNESHTMAQMHRMIYLNKEPLIIGLFCRKYHVKMRHPTHLRTLYFQWQSYFYYLVHLVAKYYAKIISAQNTTPRYISNGTTTHENWSGRETNFELKSYFHDLSYLGAKYGANGTHFSHTPVPTWYSMPQFATPWHCAWQADNVQTSVDLRKGPVLFLNVCVI